MGSNRGFYERFDEIPLLTSDNEEEPLKRWDTFKNTPRKVDSGSDSDSKKLDFGVKVLKLLLYLVVFLVILFGGVISKATLLLVTSQIKGNISREYCNQCIGDRDRNRQFLVNIPTVERVVWIWTLIFIYFIPQILTFIRSAWICFFKKCKFPSKSDYLEVFITETLPAIGSALLVFVVLPDLDVLKGAMLTNAVCFIPVLIGFISRDFTSWENPTAIALDIFSLLAQASSLIAWPLIENKTSLYFIPLSLLLISMGWWENYLDENSPREFIRRLAQDRKEFPKRKYFAYACISVVNCFAFLCTALIVLFFQEGEVSFVFDLFDEAFSYRKIDVIEIPPYFNDLSPVDASNVISLTHDLKIDVTPWTPLTILLINALSTFICYAFAKFACRVMIQEFSFAFSLNITVPVLLSVLISLCGQYLEDVCAFKDYIETYIFFQTPPMFYLNDFIFQHYGWMWVLWLLSQIWITMHIWTPKCEKLAETEHLFLRPMYDAFLIDQSVTLNRRRDDEPLKYDETEIDESQQPIPHIYVCATMWHETAEEMVEFLKSIMRLDADYCAHRIAKYLINISDLPSYYKLESHIFFDDAFIRKDKTDEDPLLNDWVHILIKNLSVAASEVHGITNFKIRPPKIYSTPYGGRLEWTLPGRSKLIAHLKDKKKIRAKKRWSQVMYMYYLLGYKLMDNDEIGRQKKQLISENTYILALDGDIDFKPEAVHLLVEYMKKNRNLGAACGRIHPVGSGAMAWYQTFEYAVGHWLQKATEHVVGCVLCSPGCFSLFRGRALMENRVMAKYTTRSTEARHYVQYDQGEDRWLCTLLLQMGYRVEYCAASDAYTHCPEGFNEFYNQRRRWMPSTTANILDLLQDYKHVVKINDNISLFYVFYQTILLVGTVIGPGNIFLMLVGGMVAVFKCDQFQSFTFNLIPILIFGLVCVGTESKTQLMVAGILSAFYGLLMMAVLVGVSLQIHDDGFFAPSSLFFFFLLLEFAVAAILHPKEFYCLKYGIIYYVTVPSMYMLLSIYSAFNMNDVSWGTREITVVKKQEKEEEDEDEDDPKPEEKKRQIFSFFGEALNKTSGSIDISFASLFRCMLCTHENDENDKLSDIKNALEALNKKMDAIDGKTGAVEEGPQTREVLPEVTPEKTGGNAKKAPTLKPAKDELVVNNSWFYDELLDGHVHFLEDNEKKFWKDLIKKYLFPIAESKKFKKKIAGELKDLRDKVVFSFFMINALFVLTIFLLNLKKDVMHIDWPFNAKSNFTYDVDHNQVLIYKEYLQLEPIGFVFLISFAGLIFIQSIGMFVHRFETFSQVMANTNIKWNPCAPNVEKDPKNLQYISKSDALYYAKKYQRCLDVYKSREEEDPEEFSPQRRQTVHNMAMRNDSKPQIYDLVEAFRYRMNMPEEDAYGKDQSVISKIKARHSVCRRQTESNLTQQAGKPVELPEFDLPDEEFE